MNALPNPDYESLPKYQRYLGGLTNELRREALAKFLPPFQENYRRHLTSPLLNYDVRIDRGDAILRQLQQDGCALSRVSPDVKSPVVERVESIARALHARLDQLPNPRFKDSQRQFEPKEHAALFQLVDELLERENVYAAGSAYVGKRIVLKTLAVQVNSQRATALTYGELDERGRPQPWTRYLHIDSAFWPPLKVLIYLDPVGEDQGPFRYVVGSHRLASDFELVVRKTNDKASIHNALFMALPRAFRMYTEFGDAMTPDGEEASALLNRERAYCDGVSDLVLFDFNGVHRGGFVRRGHRYILQCCFSAAA
ncbi:MAG TPA: hypothetical protein VIJ94_20440 [Caulobacteraceae bacterium]